MSYRDRPEFCAPDDQRCEAIVRGTKQTYQHWRQVDHRCVRRAQQSRMGCAVCHIHARVKEVQFIAEAIMKLNGAIELSAQEVKELIANHMCNRFPGLLTIDTVAIQLSESGARLCLTDNKATTPPWDRRQTVVTG